MKWGVFIPKDLENCKMVPKAGSFYRMQNKEQRKERWKMNKEQGSKCRAQWRFAIATGYTAFLVKQSIYRYTKVI